MAKVRKNPGIPEENINVISVPMRKLRLVSRASGSNCVSPLVLRRFSQKKNAAAQSAAPTIMAKAQSGQP